MVKPTAFFRDTKINVKISEDTITLQYFGNEQNTESDFRSSLKKLIDTVIFLAPSYGKFLEKLFGESKPVEIDGNFNNDYVEIYKV